MKAFLIGLTFLMSLEGLAETFHVALPMLPDVNPITNQINSGNYIGAHLYYPLFERKNDGSLNSVFLNIEKSKSLDQKFENFQLCIKSDVKFSDNSPLTLNDLTASLKALSEMYPQSLPVRDIKKMSEDCVHLFLKEGVPGLFNRLTGMASTILKADNVNKPFPIGKGPYQIEKKSDEEIILKSTLEIPPRFDKIAFELIKKIDSDVSQFSDINQLPPNKERDAKFNGKRIEAPSLKIYSFVLNVKDKSLRDTIRYYLEQEPWAENFGLTLVGSTYFLPWLNSNYSISNIKRDVKPKTKISFIVPDFYDVKKIKTAINNSFLKELLIVRSMPSIKFAEWAFSGKEYVGVMGFDSSGSISSLEGDFSVYFESFFSKHNRIVTKSLLPVREIIEKSINRKINSTERFEFMKKAEKFLSDNDYISPLGKVKRTFLYPENIKIPEWVDFFSGIPRIDRIQ